MFRIHLQFCPESADIYGKRILIYKFPLAVPHMFQDLLFGENPVPVLHKIQKKLIFIPAQEDLFSISAYPAAVLIDDDPAGDKPAALLF